MACCAAAPVLPKRIRKDVLESMTSNTSLTAAEVKALYERFRRLAPSGYLMRQQFQQTMGVMGLTDDHFLADRMFEVFDSDQDGSLSFEEFASALAIMIRGSEDEKLALSFKMVAGREAKGVRLEDFQHLVASCHRMMSSLVAPSGRLSSEEDVKRLFHSLATRESDEEVISLEAYKAAAQENLDFLACLGLASDAKEEEEEEQEAALAEVAKEEVVLGWAKQLACAGEAEEEKARPVDADANAWETSHWNGWQRSWQSFQGEPETSRNFSKEGYRIDWVSRREAKLMLTMQGFTSFHISRTIGKRGSNLLEIGRRTGTRVHLCGKDSNRPTSEPNHLLIRGDEERVEKALVVACQKVEEVLTTDIPICEHCGADHKSRDCRKIRQAYVRHVYVDPSANVGFIIGSGGRNVKPIKDETRALIRMCGIGSGELRATEPLHMRIECPTAEELEVAAEMAQELIGRVCNWSPYDEMPPQGHKFANQLKIELELGPDRESYDSINAHLLGKGGQNFRRIRDATGAWVWLRGQGSGFGASDEPLHLLVEHDDQEAAERALQMAQELLDSVCARLGSTFCRICGGPHFTYRCSKANSAGYLKEMKAKGAGRGRTDDEQIGPKRRREAEPTERSWS
ncbi:unnamed protein product [Effrenium voratum]|nr:unnamed protein product [Effrenium voratum]